MNEGKWRKTCAQKRKPSHRIAGKQITRKVQCGAELMAASNTIISGQKERLSVRSIGDEKKKHGNFNMQNRKQNAEGRLRKGRNWRTHKAGKRDVKLIEGRGIDHFRVSIRSCKIQGKTTVMFNGKEKT